MAAYCLFDNLEVVDGLKMEEYKARVATVVQRYGGRYLVRGGKVELMEGQWRPSFPVMIEFPESRARSRVVRIQRVQGVEGAPPLGGQVERRLHRRALIRRARVRVRKH